MHRGERCSISGFGPQIILVRKYNFGFGAVGETMLAIPHFVLKCPFISNNYCNFLFTVEASNILNQINYRDAVSHKFVMIALHTHTHTHRLGTAVLV